MDHHSKPVVQKLPSYVEDTPDVLRKIAKKNRRGPLPPTAIPVTMDVTALYPSVPHEEGLENLESALNKRHDKSVPTTYIVMLMKLVLTLNTFEWDSKLYNQRHGTAIGTRAAPTFSGIFMGNLEERLLQMWGSLDPAMSPDDWIRFLDDILFWWLGTPGDLLIFINFANQLHPDIKFTCEFDFESRSVVFLDLIIWVDESGYIQTDLHTKENAKNSYLLPQSNHPSHICRNIPYSLAYRIKRNCSQQEQCELRFVELTDKLVARGYRKRAVESAVDRVRQLDRDSILEKVIRLDNNSDRVRAVFKFDRRLPSLSVIFRKNWQTMVTDDRRLLGPFPGPPMICYTRGKNLREEVCRAKLPSGRVRRGEEPGFKRCMRPACRLCPFTGLQPGEVLKKVRISNSGEELQVKGKITCQTSNILYIGTCAKEDRSRGTCPTRPQYAGETGCTAEERFVGHRNSIVQAYYQGTSMPVGHHFQQAGHSVSDFVFTPVERIYSNNIFVRKARERNLINTMDLIDNGLNKQL